MSYTKIRFNALDVVFKEKRNPIKRWINETVTQHGYTIKDLSFTFCKDEYLLRINQQYLNHDDFTDIITFDLRDNNSIKSIEGDIYISLERVNENALVHKTTKKKELLRVIIHGALHLCGLKDKKDEDKEIMRRMENNALEKFNAMFHVE